MKEPSAQKLKPSGDAAAQLEALNLPTFVGIGIDTLTQTIVPASSAPSGPAGSEKATVPPDPAPTDPAIKNEAKPFRLPLRGKDVDFLVDAKHLLGDGPKEHFVEALNSIEIGNEVFSRFRAGELPPAGDRSAVKIARRVLLDKAAEFEDMAQANVRSGHCDGPAAMKAFRDSARIVRREIARFTRWIDYWKSVTPPPTVEPEKPPPVLDPPRPAPEFKLASDPADGPTPPALVPSPERVIDASSPPFQFDKFSYYEIDRCMLAYEKLDGFLATVIAPGQEQRGGLLRRAITASSERSVLEAAADAANLKEISAQLSAFRAKVRTEYGRIRIEDIQAADLLLLHTAVPVQESSFLSFKAVEDAGVPDVKPGRVFVERLKNGRKEAALAIPFGAEYSILLMVGRTPKLALNRIVAAALGEFANGAEPAIEPTKAPLVVRPVIVADPPADNRVVHTQNYTLRLAN